MFLKLILYYRVNIEKQILVKLIIQLKQPKKIHV